MVLSFSSLINLISSQTESASIPINIFDQGVTVAVLTAGGIVGSILLRRWLRLMDNIEERDRNHLAAIEEHRKEAHVEMMEAHAARIERDVQTAKVLESISHSLEVLRDSLK